MKKILVFLLSVVLLLSIVPSTYAAGNSAEELIKAYKISLTNVNSEPLNQEILVNRKEVVYGSPSGTIKNGKYRWLGYSYEGVLFSNTLYPPDLDATGNVNKTWVSEPWNNETAFLKGAYEDTYRFDPNAINWLDSMLDPYDTTGQTKWLDSYNALTGAGWTTDTLLDYAVIQSPPTQFGQGVVVMYNTNGQWYQDFIIPPLMKITEVGIVPVIVPNPTPTPTPTLPSGGSIFGGVFAKPQLVTDGSGYKITLIYSIIDPIQKTYTYRTKLYYEIYENAADAFAQTDATKTNPISSAVLYDDFVTLVGDSDEKAWVKDFHLPDPGQQYIKIYHLQSNENTLNDNSYAFYGISSVRGLNAKNQGTLSSMRNLKYRDGTPSSPIMKMPWDWIKQNYGYDIELEKPL